MLLVMILTVNIGIFMLLLWIVRVLRPRKEESSGKSEKGLMNLVDRIPVNPHYLRMDSHTSSSESNESITPPLSRRLQPTELNFSNKTTPLLPASTHATGLVITPPLPSPTHIRSTEVEIEHIYSDISDYTRPLSKCQNMPRPPIPIVL